ncbi:ribonuclease III domain-containing protein [Spirulina sp. 06S082]|uniref:ribonuclease III domain-containing protein n=1 Tax=Spirulina sp. 06S082 TaxID=3110248 RepID=UPI002B218E9B|nr:ribonuclease III domain-containing protein [Spirulina sp. 06S082]MEA5472197.1 ribonuclease III domain-containing protein [Spirulina sp. 06S082]
MNWNHTPIEQKIEFNFKHPDLLFLALSHPSYAKEFGDPEANNERLAFLGEVVYKLTLTHYLYYNCPYLPVDKYKGLLQKLIGGEQLTKTWFRLGLGESYPFLALKEDRAVLRQKRNNPFGSAFLALVGAMHCDRGFAQARNWLIKRAISPLLASRLQSISERVEPITQVKFLGNVLLGAIATDIIYSSLPGVEVKNLNSFYRELTGKTRVTEYKKHSQDLGNDSGKGFKEFLGEKYLEGNEANNRTAFNQMRDWFQQEFVNEEDFLRNAIAQLLKAGKPQKWIVRTVLGYASKDYDAGRDRFHELMDEKGTSKSKEKTVNNEDEIIKSEDEIVKSEMDEKGTGKSKEKTVNNEDAIVKSEDEIVKNEEE